MHGPRGSEIYVRNTPPSLVRDIEGNNSSSSASVSAAMHEATFAVVSSQAQAQEAVVVSFEAKPLLPTSTGVNPVGSPRSKSSVIFKYVKGLTKTWKERVMTVDAANPGICMFSDSAVTLSLKNALVEVMWAYEEKTGGQKYQFSILEQIIKKQTNETKETKEQQQPPQLQQQQSQTQQIQQISPKQASGVTNGNKCVVRVPNLLEFDNWLTTLQSHGCIINRPIKVGSMMLSKKREESWFVLYSDGLHYYKQKTDDKATKIVPIGEGCVFEKLESDSFCLSETGDDQAISIECTPPFAEALAWFDAIEAAVRQRLKKKVMQSIREGYLSKCAKNMKFWKKRYFVLMPDHMKYFKKRFDEQHAGIINLPPGAEAEEEDNPADPSLKYLFWVAENGDDSGTRRYYMTAKSDAEKESWLQTLHTMFAKKNPQVVPLSIKEGYLYKASGAKSLGTSWSKRYFVLLKDKLIYFKKRNDSTPKGSIDLLQGAEVCAFTDVNINKHPMISIAENGDEEGTRTYYLYAKDALTRTDWLEVITNLLKTKNPRVNEHSVKEGYMRKQGYTNKWHKRYFVLLEKNLLYYKKRGDKQEAGEIPLPGSAEVVRVDSDDAENKWQFSVAENGDESGTRIYHMSAPSAELRTQWMQHLQKIIKAKDSRIMIGSFLEGYLWKCPEKGGAWRKRYFVLQQNQLLYFRKRADETEAGSIEIKGEAEINIIDDDLDHPYAFTVAKNGDEGERQVKIYASDHMTRNEWINALKHQASLLAVKENPNSIREGYLYHWTSSQWRKRFFTLEQSPVGVLSLFVKRKDTKPSLKFLLEKETVVVLLNDRIPPHGSAWGKHESLANKQDLPGPPEEKLLLNGEKAAGEDNNNNMIDTERNGEDGINGGGEKETVIVLCKNGDSDSKNIRLKGVYDNGEHLVTDIMMVCVSKEFPPTDVETIKSGYLACRYKATGLSKTDRWISSFVTLTKDKFQFYKNVEEEYPVSICTLDTEAKFYIGPVSGSAVWNALCMTLLDKNDREICATAQSKEEKQSWSNAITRSLSLLKENKVPFRTDLFGAELGKSFSISILYRMPSVITLCVEFLRSAPFSAVLLKYPGFHPLVRSFIQDFETGQEVALTDPDSVAACLRLYLVMLKKPIVPDATCKSFLDILAKTKKMATNTVSNNEKFVVHQFHKIVSALETETSIALSTLLHYLSHELKRTNNEPSVSLEALLPIWAPLLMRFREEKEAEFDNKSILNILLRNIDTFFPGGAPIGVRKLPLKKLKSLREQCNTLSFDVLYKDKYGLELFRRFVKENYIEEEIKFLSAAQQYREMCENPSNSQTQCLAAALLICATYIKQGAETQVNVAATLSNTVLAQFEDPKSAVRSKNLTGNEFAIVEAEAVILITTNAYPRFKQSEGFDHWITHRETLAQGGLLTVEDEGSSLLGLLKKMATDTKTEYKASPSLVPLSPTSSDPAYVPLETAPPAKTAITAAVSESEGAHHNEKPALPKAKPPPPPVASSDPASASIAISAGTNSSGSASSNVTTTAATTTTTTTNTRATATSLDTSTSSSASQSIPSNASISSSTTTASPITTSVSDSAPKTRSMSFIAPPVSSTSSESLHSSQSEEVWFKRKSPSKGVSYYINIVTKQTTWKVPDTGAIYSCMVDDEGRMYCVNVREKTSSWEVPEVLKEFVEIYKVI